MNKEEACKILNISLLDINEYTLKQRYRQALLTHHPDKQGDPEIFIKVKEAYEILKQ